MPDLSIENLTLSYQQKKVIDGLSLAVENNQIVCLLGASGCGKTTTLKVIAGLLQPDQGQVSIYGNQVNADGLFLPSQQRNIGMMFQDYALFPHLTVAENVGFGLSSWSKTEAVARVDEMLELVRLQEFKDRYPHQLSGGQQQRVAIARALAYKPKLLLLDEPFSNIDHQVRFSLIEEIRAIIKAQQVAAVFVTHSKEEAFAFADKLAIMDQGKINQLGTPEQIYNGPKSRFVAEFLGAGVYVPAEQKRDNLNQFSTEYGEVESSSPVFDELEIGGEIFVRPQHIELQAPVRGQATVVSKRFLGTRFIYRLRTGSQEIEVSCSTEQVYLPGEKVDLKILSHPVNYFL